MASVYNIKKLILGTAQLGMEYGINNQSGQPNVSDAIDIINYAHGQGIRILDTAEAYGNAYELIRRFHSLYSDKKFNIISKIRFNRQKHNNILDYLKRSLIDLNIDSFYALIVHRYNDLIEHPEFLDHLTEAKSAKLLNKTGVSIYTNEQFEYCIRHKNIDLIQFPFNLLDNLNQRGDLIREAKLEGKLLHARSIFLQGLFFKPLKNVAGGLSKLRPCLKLIQNISRKENIPIHELALKYVYGQDNIDGILFGVDTINQLKENVQIIESVLNPAVSRQINEIIVPEISLLNPTNWN